MTAGGVFVRLLATVHKATLQSLIVLRPFRTVMLNSLPTLSRLVSRCCFVGRLTAAGWLRRQNTPFMERNHAGFPLADGITGLLQLRHDHAISEKRSTCHDQHALR